MNEKLQKNTAKKPSLVLMQRDIAALLQLHVHRAMTSSQLAALCFPDITYETSRKRLRKIQQAGYMNFAASDRLEGRGRPELVYYLTTAGAKALEQYENISWDTISTGPPHAYHKEHYLRLVDIRLSLQEMEKKHLISDLEWMTGKEFWKQMQQTSEEQADAAISFRYPSTDTITVLLEIDTGNFRQTRHWEPKIKAFLATGCPIWVVTNSLARVHTLRSWTTWMLDEAGVGPGKVVFCVYDEILDKGIFGATWYRTDGSITDLRPKT